MSRLLALVMLAVLPLVPLAAAGAPEITVLRNSTVVADNSTDTVYGAVAGTALRITYAISNTGAAPLTISAPITPGGFVNCTSVAVVTQPTATIAAGTHSDLVLDLTTTAAGAWSFTISFTTDDTDEPLTNWTASGTAVAVAVAKAAVTRGATAVADGSTDTISGFTELVQEDVVYTITNTGSAALTIATWAFANPSNCDSLVIVSSPAASVAVGASTSFVVRLRPNATPWSCDAQFTCNDTTASTYNWTLSGTAVALASEISVSRGASAILNGSTDTISSGGTAGSATSNLTYTISNLGTTTLTLSAPTYSNQVNCSATTVTTPVTSIPTVSQTTYAMNITPSTNADWSVLVTLGNNDANESPTTWTIRGTATAGGSPTTGGAAGGGGCGAGGTTAGLLLAFAMLGLRRRR